MLRGSSETSSRTAADGFVQSERASILPEGGGLSPRPPSYASNANTTALSASLRDQISTSHALGTGRGGGAMGVRTDGMVRSSEGPIDVARWQRSPEQVLGHLTQRPSQAGGAADANAPDRCGAANLLGVSVMSGPTATRTMLTRAAENPGTSLIESERSRLREIAGHIDPANPSASRITYQELNEAQGLLYRAGNTRADARGELNDIIGTFDAARRTGDRETMLRYDQAIGSGPVSQASWRRLREWNGHSELPAGDQVLLRRLMETHRGPGDYTLMSAPDPQNPSRQEYFFRNQAGAGEGEGTRDGSRFDDGELLQLARRSMGSATSAQAAQRPDPQHRDQTQADLGALMGGGAQGLQSGQAATFRVRATEHSTSSDHYVTVGRTANGQYYLYNPDPGLGDATLITGSRAQVQRAADEYDPRMLRDGDRDRPNLVITRPPQE